MTDQNENPNNAPTFEPIEGGSRSFTLDPVNEGNGMAVTRQVTMTFGKYTGKANAEGVVPAPKGRWQAEIVRVVDGVEDVVDGRAPDPKKALASCLKSVSGAVSMDDYDLSFFDEEKEFFAQKLAAPAKPVYDPATIITIGDDEMSLAEVRGVIETDLTTIKEKGEEGQAAMFHAADAIKTVWVALKRDIKSTKRWAEEGSNVPQVAALGKGVNALQEFIDIGRLRPSERAVAPVSTQSGKGLNGFRNTAQAVLLNGANGDSSGPLQRFAADRGHDPAEVFAGDYWVGKGDDAVRVLSPKGVADFLRTIAADSRLTDIGNASELSLNDLADKFDERVAARSEQFIAEGGRHYSMYNDVEAAAMRRVYGLVQAAGVADVEHHNMSGSFRKAVEYATVLDRLLNGGDDKLADKKMSESLNPRVQPLLSAIQKGLAAECAKREQERKLDELHEQVDEAGEGIAKAERKRFADLDTNGAAARLYSLLTSRMGKGTPDDARAVHKVLGQLLTTATEDETDEAA